MASFNTLIDDFKKSFSFLKNHPLLSTSPPPPAISNGAPSQKILDLLHPSTVSAFIKNPRIEDLSTLGPLAVVLVTLAVTMSWFSRSGGSWGAGRFSPFGRPGSNPNSTEVTDDNYSYITKEDLENESANNNLKPSSGGPSGGRRRASSRTNAQPEIVDWEDANPSRETDVLVFRQGRTNYPTHFPAQSIRDGELNIGTIRMAAAKKMGVGDPSRIRMFFKGHNLKFDDRTAREEGLRGDGSGSEILCVVGESGTGGLAPGAEERYGSEGFGDEEEESEEGDERDGLGKKKPRKRGGKKNKRKGGAPVSGTSSPGMGYSNATATPSEYIPMPSNFSAPKPASPSPKAGQQPQTPLGKMDALASKFHTEFVPLCVAYIQNPPEDKAKRVFEYKKLSESILAQVLLKLDGVETEGDQEARARRKELVREVNGMLNRLDELNK